MVSSVRLVSDGLFSNSDPEFPTEIEKSHIWLKPLYCEDDTKGVKTQSLISALHIC
jgi:hypothetical protein